MANRRLTDQRRGPCEVDLVYELLVPESVPLPETHRLDPDAVNESVRRAYQAISDICARVCRLERSSVNLGVTGAGIERVRLQLTTPTTPISVSGAADGLIVLLYLEQDTVGSRTVTWPTTWLGMRGIQPSPTPSTYSVFMLDFLSATVARLAAQPILGVALS